MLPAGGIDIGGWRAAMRAMAPWSNAWRVFHVCQIDDIESFRHDNARESIPM